MVMKFLCWKNEYLWKNQTVCIPICIFNFLVVIQIFIHKQLHEFHMVVTRSSIKSESMSNISEEIREYFSELIKPLATNTSLKEMFHKIKEEVKKFEPKISQQNDKIYELESRVAIQEETINNLLTWWSKDTDIIEGLKLFSLTSSNGISQLINEPTHIQTNSISCIDLKVH